jgi:hypothetical protein
VVADRGALLGVTESRRRFPPPWTVEEYRGIAYIVRDANNFPVAYVYFESERGKRAAANLMTRDEAKKSRLGSPSCGSC